MVPDRLTEVAQQVYAGENPKATVRGFLSWFGQKRRGYTVVTTIREALAELNLVTEPDFENVWIDADISFDSSEAKLVETPADEITVSTNGNPCDEAEPVVDTLVSGHIADPTFRIGQLTSANTKPISVNPNATLAEAITLMMMHDFSQLPVMQDTHNCRGVKGVISWESIGKCAALGCPCSNVRDCIETNCQLVDAVSPLFEAIDQIIDFGYVLVRQNDNTIAGIVTTSDLSLEFRQLAEPFLLVGEIENCVRLLITDKFTNPQLQSARNPADAREIQTVADLTFGEYVRLLENPIHWESLSLKIDRNVFIKRLKEVHDLRNEVAHFAPDPIEEDNIELLRKFVNFMRDLVGK